MSKSYLLWAFVGMVGYSLVALLVELATASGRFSGFFVLMIAASMVVISSATNAFLRGEMKACQSLSASMEAFLLGTGVALAIAVSTGPASIVVPVFGMFIVGGAVLGLMFLHDPFTLRKAIGILLTIASIYLIAGHQNS